MVDIENLVLGTEHFRVSIWHGAIYIYPKTECGTIRVCFRDGKIERIEVDKNHVEKLVVEE